MIPPPSTTSRRGTSVCASRPVESTQRGESRPGIGGRIGYEPVATIALVKVTSSPPSTASVFASVKRPVPWTHVDAVRLEERRDAAGHLLDDRGLPLVRLREVERRLAGRRRRASGRSRARRGARARSAPTPSSGCSRRAGTFRRARAPARRRRRWRRAAPPGSPPCSRQGRRRGRRRRHSIARDPIRRPGALGRLSSRRIVTLSPPSSCDAREAVLLVERDERARCRARTLRLSAR